MSHVCVQGQINTSVIFLGQLRNQIKSRAMRLYRYIARGWRLEFGLPTMRSYSPNIDRNIYSSHLISVLFRLHSVEIHVRLFFF